MPILWKGKLQQHARRPHREHAVTTHHCVVDLFDQWHPALLRMWLKGQLDYKAMGYRIRKGRSVTIATLARQHTRKRSAR